MVEPRLLGRTGAMRVVHRFIHSRVIHRFIHNQVIHSLWKSLLTHPQQSRYGGETMNGTSFRLAMAQNLLATLAEAEKHHGRTATTALRATVARFIAELLV